MACSDFRTDLMDEFGRQYDVPPGGQYTDFREMVAAENLDIISVATHVEHHAEVVIALADAGVKAIFCEKGLSPSLGEANAMAEACNRNGTILNMGAQRRYHPGFRKMREIIDSGELGAVQNMVMTYGAGLFDHGCHVVDLLTYLIGDPHAVWVQGNAPASEAVRDGNVYSDDPGGDGVILFENGVTAYLPNTVATSTWSTAKGEPSAPSTTPSGSSCASGRPKDTQGGPVPGLRDEQPHRQPHRRPRPRPRYRRPASGGMESARHGVEIMVAILESHLRAASA